MIFGFKGTSCIYVLYSPIMLSDATGPLRDHGHTRSFLVEAVSAEKKLWTQIQSKGMLHLDVQELYRKTRSNYEKIILIDHELAELQDIEYSLWRLHYKCIDEFRNRIRQTSANPENKNQLVPHNLTTMQKNNDNLVEGFRSFLSEASEFYQELIIKIRRNYVLPEELLFFKDECFSNSMESTIMHRCQFSCHRCLIYLGDLARYRELYAKPATEKNNWSFAATHYLNASMIWPDSGNPHNQLAVLATYIGDDFLALYHCIRSLAVKNPFPDAWDNLNLLFEKNRSSNLPSLSTEATFDFNTPSERSTAQTKMQSSDSSSTSNMCKITEDFGSEDTSFWPLIVRTISNFYTKSSLEEFSCTFGSAIRELDILLSLDDLRLTTALESYQHMDACRTGPFRALQLVSILIFTIRTLSESPKPQALKHVEDLQQPVLLQLALVSTFICMGRIVNRCVMTNHVSCSPLLPAISVFAEWLPDMVEMYEADENYANAIIYFFSAFVDLLNKFDHKEGENETLISTVLWEDHELQGFAPISHAHTPLKFSTEERHSFDDDEHECQIRIHRICLAAMKLTNRSNGRKWIFYDKEGRRFCTMKSEKLPEMRQSEEVEPRSDPNVKELQQPQQHPELKHGTPLHEATNERKEQISEGDGSNLDVHGNIPVEDEEVILFKPIIRYNSAPLYFPGATSCDTVPSAQCLRRGLSSVAENHYGSEVSSSLSNIASSSCNMTYRQKETLTEDSFKCTFSETSIAAGPPSLSAWVLNREILGVAGKKGTNDMGNCGLGCSDDVASAHLSHLSISGTSVTQQDIRATSPTSASKNMYAHISEGDFVIAPGYASATTCYSPFPYSAPLPSAPLLPDDATWFHDDSSNYAEFKDLENMKVPNFLSAPQVNSQSNWSRTQGPFIVGPGVADYTYGYKPVGSRSDSTLQLHQYLDHTSDNIGSNHLYTPTALGNFHNHDISRLGHHDQWRNPLTFSSMKYLGGSPLYPGLSPVQDGEEQVRDILSHGYQRPVQFGYGTAVDLRPEPHLLLQYLKEREWRKQGSPN